MLTEAEIVDRGVIKNVPLVLGDGDDHAPAGHWFNTSGIRMYSERRVKIAEKLISTAGVVGFMHPEAEELNAQELPCTPAIFIFDYKTVLPTAAPGLAGQIRGQRISHPRHGRVPGSQHNELLLIQQALQSIIEFAYPGLAARTAKNALKHLDKIAADAPRAFKEAWPNVTLRRPKLRYNTSRGKSRKAAIRILDVLSLIHSGGLSHEKVSLSELNIFEILAWSPTLRVDHKISKPI